MPRKRSIPQDYGSVVPHWVRAEQEIAARAFRVEAARVGLSAEDLNILSHTKPRAARRSLPMVAVAMLGRFALVFAGLRVVGYWTGLWP